MAPTPQIDAATMRRIDDVVTNWQREKKVDLVLEGGGVLGIGLVGTYATLCKAGYKAQNLAGTSAGAIVGALIAAEYTPEDIYQTIFNLDFKKLMDPTPLLRSRRRGGTVAA